jgi:hypothetical protein
MLDSFLIAFRESLQCAVVAALVIHYPGVRDNRRYLNSLIAGLSVALIAGFSAGYIPYATTHLWTNESWTFWRYISESVIFYLSVLFLVVRFSPPPLMVYAGLFLLGLLIFVFEARAVGFLIQDIGAMKGKALSVFALGAAGIIAGFMPLVLFKRFIRKIPFDKAFTFPSLLMVIGALQFGFGGVGELEKENILIPLQRGFINFLGEAIKSLQSAFLIQGHPFIKTTFSGLADFLSGDRTAMTLTLLFIMAPPLLILSHLFSRPDPVISSLQAGAQRRYQIAFFRKELMYQTTPVLTAFVILIVLLHAVNISLNPLYEPLPVPIREAGDETVLKIPLSDKAGDFSDKKLRKYVYYYENKQVVFIAMLKPDGSVGVALDECEICRPADWNTDAKGYAQRGEHLVCKYCMTPIAAATLNNPGGCNPIPLPFSMQDNTIVITRNDLITTFKKVQELEKKGTHL